jgi:hypothetical protein
LKFGPATPTRMNSTMACGDQAKLMYVSGYNPFLFSLKPVPLISLEVLHPKDSDNTLDKRDNDDAHLDSHCTVRDGREDLTADDAIDGAPTDHEDDVQESAYLGWVVPEEEAKNDLFSKGSTLRSGD